MAGCRIREHRPVDPDRALCATHNAMKQARAGLAGLSPTDKVAKALLVETMMNGNAAFVTPVPTLLEVKAGRDTLATAITEAASGDHAKVFAKQVAEAALDSLIVRIAMYVTNTAKGNETIILSSGLEVRKGPSRIGKLPAPENLSARSGSFTGQVDTHWDKVHGAYEYEMYANTTDPNDASKWLLVGIVSRTRFTVQGLEPGKAVWFRVTASGAAGTSPASDPAKGYAAPEA